jgi:hypothetical protein
MSKGNAATRDAFEAEVEHMSEGPNSASIRRVAFASFIGTAIEWYDFFLYATAAALIFPKLFFPQFSPLQERWHLLQLSVLA